MPVRSVAGHAAQEHVATQSPVTETVAISAGVVGRAENNSSSSP